MADSSDKENEAAPPRYRGIDDELPDAKEKKRKRKSLKKVVLSAHLLTIRQLIDAMFFLSRPSKPMSSNYPSNASSSSNRTASSKNYVELVLSTMLRNLTRTARETMRLSLRKGREAMMITVPSKRMLCRLANDTRFVTNYGLTLQQFGTWSMSRRAAQTLSCYQMDRKR